MIVETLYCNKHHTIPEIPVKAGIHRPLSTQGIRLFIIAGLFCLLSACGWRPLYGPQTLNDASLNQVWIETIQREEGIILRNNLMDMFYLDGEPSQPLYTLSVSLGQSSRQLGIKKDDTATRAQLIYTATYRLHDRETLEVLHTGSAQVIASYNILDNQFTTSVSRDAAMKNALQELAEKIRTRLGLYFDRLSSS